MSHIPRRNDWISSFSASLIDHHSHDAWVKTYGVPDANFPLKTVRVRAQGVLTKCRTILFVFANILF